VGTAGTLEQIVHGPSAVPDGSMNLMGALRRTIATAGYSDLKEFQRVEVVVAPGAPRDAHGPQNSMSATGPIPRVRY
jgi:IMP dehydrogenase